MFSLKSSDDKVTLAFHLERLLTFYFIYTFLQNALCTLGNQILILYCEGEADVASGRSWATCHNQKAGGVCV